MQHAQNTGIVFNELKIRRKRPPGTFLQQDFSLAQADFHEKRTARQKIIVEFAKNLSNES